MEKNLKRLKNLKFAIGHTPMYEIQVKYKDNIKKVYAKAEHYNFTGSIKDRMALHILTRSYEEGLLKEGYSIAEATSGNTGIAFAGLGAALGHKVIICMPNWMSEERKALISAFGSEIRLISKEEGGFLGSIDICNNMAKQEKGIFLPHQFSNSLNAEAHFLTTGPEIEAQLASIGLMADGFVAGVGTGGTVMGIGRYLKHKNPATKIFPLEPENSPTMSTGYKVGSHRIQGISDEFIPEIVKLNELNDIIAVDDGDSIIMSQKLAKVGIAVGISSGANLLGALIAHEKLGDGKTIVTVFSDDNKKYVSTDLMKKEPSKEHFLTNRIEILDYHIISSKDVH